MQIPQNYKIVWPGTAKSGDMHHVGNTAGTNYAEWEPVTDKMVGYDYSGFRVLIRAIKHCAGECQLGKSIKIWCASDCMAYESLNAQGYPYMRAPLTLGELPSDTHLSHVDDFVGNALLSIGLTVSGDNYGYGTPLFRATDMTFKESKNHPYSELLLTLICDLPIRFIS